MTTTWTPGAQAPAVKPAARQRARRPLRGYLLDAALLAVSVVCLYPFLLALFGSFKTANELGRNPAGPPAHPTTANYVDLVTGYAGQVMVRAFLNSLFITTLHTALTVAVCALGAYAFTRYRFPGNKLLFYLLIASMLVPVEINIPPLYSVFAKLGWLNTYNVQIVPGIANVLGLFILRQYMRGLPPQLFEAAHLDGAGHWTTFRRILLPLSWPALGAVAIIVFVAKWTDYLWPAVMVNDPARLPVMVILPNLNTTQNSFTIPYELVLTGAVVITVPVVAVFLAFQKRLLTTTTGGAVRG